MKGFFVHSPSVHSKDERSNKYWLGFILWMAEGFLPRKSGYMFPEVKTKSVALTCSSLWCICCGEFTDNSIEFMGIAKSLPSWTVMTEWRRKFTKRPAPTLFRPIPALLVGVSIHRGLFSTISSWAWLLFGSWIKCKHLLWLAKVKICLVILSDEREKSKARNLQFKYIGSIPVGKLVKPIPRYYCRPF